MDDQLSPTTSGNSESGSPPRTSYEASEARYMQGANEPLTSSVLISNSKFLNSPNYRDVFSQAALRRHGRDLPETYLIPKMVAAINEVKDFAEYARLLEEEKQKKPAFAAWLKARRWTDYDPRDLQACAPGTLGATIRDFIEKSGMEMQFMMKGREAASEIEYIVKRRVASHDIEHMVTGFGPNQLGEAALGFMNNAANHNYFTPQLAHHMSEHTMFTTATSYYRISLHYPDLMRHHLGAMQLGIAAGQRLKQPLFMNDWEDYLDWRLEDLAEHLGFERGPGTAWDWSRDAAVG